MKNWAKKITLLSLSALGILMADSVNAQGYYHMNPYQQKMIQAMNVQASGSRYMSDWFQQDAAYLDALRRKHIYLEHARQNQARAMKMYLSAQEMLKRNPEWRFKAFNYNRFRAPRSILQMGSTR